MASAQTEPPFQTPKRLLMWNISSGTADFLFSLSNMILIAGAALVLFGTIGSIKSGAIREAFTDLRMSENERLASADRKVAEELRAKNLALESAISPRVLEQGLTARALERFSDVSFVVISPSDLEPKRTAGQIRFVLLQAGWKRFSEALPTVFTSVFPDGVVVHPMLKRDRRREIEAATALVTILNQNGIAATVGFAMPRADSGGAPSQQLPEDAIDALVVRVGPKPLPASMQISPSNVPPDARGNRIWGNIAE